jgi:pimeloyl-ACP methyl ester carboxylesterase
MPGTANNPDHNQRPTSMKATTKWLLVGLVAIVLLTTSAWIVWSEGHPEAERELRIQVQEQLATWFPEEMALPDELIGFIPRSEHFDEDSPPEVVLVHGLDEPGGIWDQLAPALDQAGINSWEFRYPNDQAIDHSADLLAEYWPQLPPEKPLVLVGHSMGGLVIRDFVSRWRHPVDQAPRVAGPGVSGVILVGTPNQGSDWARLRVWLELREAIADVPAGRFSMFAGLRDGTGAAKIDLRPNSLFLAELNDRPWPGHIAIRIIGGLIGEPTPAMLDSIQALGEEIDNRELAEQFQRWWSETSGKMGDGAVPVESLQLKHAPRPMVLNASHRGLLVTLPFSEGEPPAIAPIIELLHDWQSH